MDTAREIQGPLFAVGCFVATTVWLFYRVERDCLGQTQSAGRFGGGWVSSHDCVDLVDLYVGFLRMLDEELLFQIVPQ
jgi:hypothetical protein